MSVSDNSRFIALSPENGTEFSAGQKIVFEVKPDISFIKGKDSYISLDLENNSDNGAMANPPMLPGANGVIERMDIFSLESGQLLESLNNYNLWSAIENQYLPEDANQTQIKQGTGQPFRAYIISSNAETKVLTRNLEFLQATELGATALSTIDSAGRDVSMTHRYVIPIRAGVFNHYSKSEKLTPNILYGGLRVEITLARVEHGLSKVKSVMDDGTSFEAVSYATGIPVDDPGGSTDVVVSADCRDAQQLGFKVGQNVTIQNSDQSQNHTRTINSITHGANKMTLGVSGGNMTIAANNPRIFHPADRLNLSYKVKNPELKVLEVVPPQEMMRQVIKESQIDFISYEVFVDNLPTTSLNHQVEFPSVASKGKAIFTHYIPDDTGNDNFTPTYYAGASPTETNLNSVQYFLNNKLYPLRAYNPNSFNDRIVAYNEMVKAFNAIGLKVNKLGDSALMGDYTFTYLTARELARGEQFVYPLKDAEAQLRLEFSEARATNHKLISFVFSVRSVMVSDTKLAVEL